MAITKVTHLIVHHADTANTATDWAAQVRTIYQDHKSLRPDPFGDIGYNYLIDPNGVIYEGRAGGDNVIGAHFSCFNSGTMGICLLGNYETAVPSSKMLQSLKLLLAWKCAQSGIDPLATVYHAGSRLQLPTICGHQDGNSSTQGCPKGTVCPGKNMYALLSSIRADVKNLLSPVSVIDTIKPTISSFYPSPTSIKDGEIVTIHFQVSDNGGSGLKEVLLMRNDFSDGQFDTRWVVINRKAVAGNGPVADTFTDRPGIGDHWYGLHVIDGNGNEIDERVGGFGPDKVSVAPATSCTITMSSPAANVEVSFPAAFAWTTSGDCPNTVLAIADRANPSSAQVFNTSGPLTVNVSDLRTIDAVFGNQATLYWAVVQSSAGVFTALSEWRSFRPLRDSIAPTVSITSPTVSDTVNTENNTIELAGSVTDQSLFSVTWNNNRGGSGNATGTSNWRTGMIPLQLGPNVITVSATDAWGNIGQDNITVTYVEAKTRIIEVGGSLDFGTLTVNGSKTLPVTIKNPGNDTLLIAAVTYPTGFSGDFVSGSIAAGASRVVNVTFNPKSVGAFTSPVVITSNATQGASEIRVSGNAIGVQQNIPQILVQPVGTTVNVGGTAMFSVTASAASSYQWRKNGIDLGGANSSVLTLNNVQSADAGSYAVAVSNSAGSILSAPAVLTVTAVGRIKGDLNGDGRADILFQDQNGFLGVWAMTAAKLDWANFLNPKKVDPNYGVVGIGDFNSDGFDDLLFQHRDGTLAVWYMNGTSEVSAEFLNPDRPSDSNWRVMSVADMNSDGLPDLVFQHVDGTLAVWFMNKNRMTGFGYISPKNPGDLNWKLVGIGDFNNDGRQDLVFQHTNGTLALWYLNGTTLIDAVYLKPSYPGDAKWRAVGVADRNGDGRPDLLFQHTDGTLAIWFMIGNVLAEAALLNPSNANGTWRVVSPK